MRTTDRKRAATLLIVSLIGLLILLPFILLANGLAEGKMLSPALFWQDLIRLEPALLLRLFGWLCLLLPPIGALRAVYLLWRDRVR